MRTEHSKHHVPAIGTLINKQEIRSLIDLYGRELVVYCIRTIINRNKEQHSTHAHLYEITLLAEAVKSMAQSIVSDTLKPVINATGIVLHTNLGRAPLGTTLSKQLIPLISGYSNIEFNLQSGCRGQRNEHIVPLLTFLTDAEDVVVVNNNAAAIILALHALARNKEVIISRGELIEIGGAFRIPEIMKASGAKMIEVGTTNKSRLVDYEQALTSKTALIFKAHRSNFTMSGFVEEVDIKTLATFSRERGIPFLYDIGSGLLRKPAHLPLEREPEVRSVLHCGVDLVAFSCDKLLGGPQAGILAGNRLLIQKCAKDPLMRALRVGKLTMAALLGTCRTYLSDEALVKNNPTFTLLHQSTEEVRARAHELSKKLQNQGIDSRVEEGVAQIGGGTVPDLTLQSSAVRLLLPAKSMSHHVSTAEILYKELLTRSIPILAVLREGSLVFEMHTVAQAEIDEIVQALGEQREKIFRF